MMLAASLTVLWTNNFIYKRILKRPTEGEISYLYTSLFLLIQPTNCIQINAFFFISTSTSFQSEIVAIELL